MMRAVSAVPFSVIPLAAYAVLVLMSARGAASLNEVVVTVTLVSGRLWPITVGDGVLTLGLVALLVSVIRAAGQGRVPVPATLARAIVLGAHVIVFLAAGFAATSVFFLLTVMAAVDTVATVSLSMLSRAERP